MNKASHNSTIVLKILNDMNDYYKPALYSIIMHCNDNTFDHHKISNILINYFDFSAKEAKDNMKDLQQNMQILCGTYTKEIVDTKLSELNKLFHNKDKIPNFIIQKSDDSSLMPQ